jgi:hypothetical protein
MKATIHLAIAAPALAASGAHAADAVIAPSPLEPALDGPALGALTRESREDVARDRVIPLVATKAATARDQYRGATLTFCEACAGRRVFIDARAYGDGVAFRHRRRDIVLAHRQGKTWCRGRRHRRGAGALACPLIRCRRALPFINEPDFSPHEQVQSTTHRPFHLHGRPGRLRWQQRRQ